MIRASSTSWRQLAWCIAFAIAMLATQFAGQTHRISHARWLNGPATLQVQAKADYAYRQWSGLADISHSCIALDAISLASGMAGAIALLLPKAGKACAGAAWHGRLRDEPSDPPFQSRAPPRFQ